jgi:hypothetical protein
MPSLTITPATLEFWLKPGATYIQSYQIQNTGPNPITLTTSVERWLPQGLDGGLSYPGLPLDLNFSLTNSDLHLGDSFILGPNQNHQLVLKISSPTTTSPKDLYFTFFVNQQLTETNTNTTNLLRLGSHLLISVSNSESESPKLSISQFRLSPSFHDTSLGSSTFFGLVENQSDFFSKIEGTITISKNNTPLLQMELFPGNVLSHYQRSFFCINDQQLPIPCRLGPPLWPGFYQATLSLKNSNSSSTINFFVLPYSLIAFFLFIFSSFLLIKYLKLHLARR